jgi:glycosyltransferase involved in cell wall biosynthesis
MIYFYVYPSAFQNPGGGEILLLKTRQYLEKQGISVRLFNMWEDKLQKGDILHVFGSVKEALGLMEVAKSKGVMIVHSPIIWYNWQSSFRIAYGLHERIKCVLRQAAKTFFPAISSERKTMMQLADVVLAGSEMEAAQIHRYFLIPKNRIKVIYYGVDSSFGQGDGAFFEKKFGLKDFVLAVGRIEPRKNQLNLIRAMNGSSIPIVIAGAAVSGHQDYYELCKKAAGPNIHFIGPLAPGSEEHRAAFRACNTFVLATWFETPGLAALEAALAGAKLVVTREGSTKEYFKDFATYINPSSTSDIRNKVLEVFQKEKTNDLKHHIEQHFMWEQTAAETARLYDTLSKRG